MSVGEEQTILKHREKGKSIRAIQPTFGLSQNKNLECPEKERNDYCSEQQASNTSANSIKSN